MSSNRVEPEESKTVAAEAKLADEDSKAEAAGPLPEALPMATSIQEASPAAPADKPGWECYDEFQDGFHDRLSKHWPQPRKQLHAGGEEMTEVFVAKVFDRLQAGATVLDLCCGEGATMVALARRFPQSRFTGIDIVPKAIAAATQDAENAKLDNVNFVCGTIFDLPFPDEEFDVILAQDPDGFSNKDRLVAFKEMFRTLKQSGCFFLHHHWIPGADWTEKQLAEYEQFHKNKGWMASAFSAKNYIDDAKNAGLCLDEVSDLTELARRHIEATAEIMKKAEGRISDDWVAMNVEFFREGRSFGVQLFGHRESMIELVNLGRYDIIKEYISKRSNEEILAIRDIYDWTVFHHAAKDGELDFIRYLVEERKIPVDIKDGNGSFPVYRAIGFGRKEVREYLMEKGTDLTHINEHGDHALHNSTDTGDEAFSFYLLEKGLCDPFLPDSFHMSSVAYALPNMPNWVMKVFDTKITEVKRFVRWRLRRYDFAFLDYGDHINGVDSIIQQIVNREVHELLQHKLILNYFQLRWDAFARRRSLLDLFEHLVDLGILIAFAVTLQFQSAGIDAQIRVIIFSILLICVSIKNLRKELLQYLDAKLVRRKYFGYDVQIKQYWTDFWNGIELTIYTMSITVAALVLVAIGVNGIDSSTFSNEGGVTDTLMIIILLFFARTLKFLSLFKMAGPYIRTILRMVSDLAIFFSFFLVFWVGFSLAWFIRFREDVVGSLWNVHRTVLEALVVGDAGDVREAIDSAGFIPQLVFVLMLLLLPLMLVNLLIAMMNNTYAIVQYKAKAEYYLLYARYILEVQAEIPEDKLRQLLLAASIRSFHNVAGENNTSIDTVAMARGFEFSPDCTWVWSDRNHLDEAEDTQSLLFLREELQQTLNRMEKRLTKMIAEGPEDDDAQEVTHRATELPSPGLRRFRERLSGHL